MEDIMEIKNKYREFIKLSKDICLKSLCDNELNCSSNFSFSIP